MEHASTFVCGENQGKNCIAFSLLKTYYLLILPTYSLTLTLRMERCKRMFYHHALSSCFLKTRVTSEPTWHVLMHILSDVKGGDLSSKPSAVILGLGNNKESLFIVSKLNYISEMPSFQSFLHSFPPLLQRSSRRIFVY